MAAETGNTYISGTMTKRRNSTANLGLSTITSLPSDCDSDAPVQNGIIGAQNVYVAFSSCRSLSQSPGAVFSSSE